MARGSENLYIWKEKKFSPKGTAALILGAVSLVVFVSLITMAVQLKTEGSMLVGAVGVTAFVCAFSGMLLGLYSFRDRCTSYAVSKVGSLLCGFMVAAWFLIYCVGLA